MMEVVRSRLKREDKGRSETLRLTFRIYERRSHNMPTSICNMSTKYWGDWKAVGAVGMGEELILGLGLG